MPLCYAAFLHLLRDGKRFTKKGFGPESCSKLEDILWISLETSFEVGTRDRVYFFQRSAGRDTAEVVGLDGDDIFLRRTDRRINNGYVVVKAATCERIVLHEAKFVQNEPLNIGKVPAGLLLFLR